MSSIPDRSGIALLSTRLTYDTGLIQFSLVVANLAKTEMTVTFSSGQEYDFYLTDEKGNEFWRWSKDKVFNPTEHVIHVKPQGFHVLDPPEPLDVSSLLPADARQFWVNSILMSSSLPAMASLSIKVAR